MELCGHPNRPTRKGGKPGARRDGTQEKLCLGFTNIGAPRHTSDRRPREILLD